MPTIKQSSDTITKLCETIYGTVRITGTEHSVNRLVRKLGSSGVIKIKLSSLKVSQQDSGDDERLPYEFDLNFDVKTYGCVKTISNNEGHCSDANVDDLLTLFCRLEMSIPSYLLKAAIDLGLVDEEN